MNNIKPNHYNNIKNDIINFCHDNNLSFLQGNVIKYIVRYKNKNGVEDLLKAREYINRELKHFNHADINPQYEASKELITNIFNTLSEFKHEVKGADSLSENFINQNLFEELEKIGVLL